MIHEKLYISLGSGQIQPHTVLYVHIQEDALYTGSGYALTNQILVWAWLTTFRSRALALLAAGKFCEESVS